ncbi:MAG: hypothetical protein IKL48_01335 [Elusimicrobiaceae bacterium]|nr:hypothetical protein [Elusimicrobiaceae bacterium]
MTIRTTQTYVIYQGNGETVRWDIPFPFLNKEDIKIYLLDEKGEKNLLTGDFEIDEENKIFYYPQPDSDALPLPSKKRLLLERETPLCQETEFLAQQSFDPSILEAGYDKAMLIAQELAAQLSRAVKFPINAESTSTDAMEYLQELARAKEDAQNITVSVQQSLSTATSAAQTALQASAAAEQAVGNLQQYAQQAADARDEAVASSQAVGQAQENILNAQISVQEAAYQALSASQTAQNAAISAESFAQDLQASQESAAQSANQAKQSAESVAESASKLDLLTESIQHKANADFSNIPPAYNYVVESYSDEDGNWYRVWKSGWLEQGGIVPTGSNTYVSVSFLKPFADTNYYVSVPSLQDNSTVQSVWGAITAKSESNTYFKTLSLAYVRKYYACGQGA